MFDKRSRRFATPRHAVVLAAVGLASIAGVASGCDSAKDLCDRACDCVGCSRSELEDCYDFAEDTARDADREGCSAQYDEYIACAHDAFRCDDGEVEYDDGCAGAFIDLAQCMS